MIGKIFKYSILFLICISFAQLDVRTATVNPQPAPAASPSSSSIESIGSCSANSFRNFLFADVGINPGTVIMLTILIIALAYMFGTILNNATLLVWYKDELFHLFVSIIFLAGITGTLSFSCVVTTSFLDFTLKELAIQNTCYTGIEPPSAVASCYMKNLERDAKDLLGKTIRRSIQYETDSTFVVTIYNPLTGAVTIPTEAYKRTYGMQLDMVAMSFLMPAVISITMQRMIVDFSSDLVRWLLPIAFIFRVFPLTRQMGNIFIAFAIALFAVLPVLYAFNGAMDQAAFNAGCTSSGAVVMHTAAAGVGVFTAFSVNDVAMGACGFWDVARLLPHAFFLPNLTAAILITFLSSMNKALRVIG